MVNRSEKNEYECEGANCSKMYHRVKHGRPQGVLQELKWWVKGERKDYYSSLFSDTHISLGTNDFHNHGKCTLFCWPVLCSYFSNICYRFGEKQSIFLCSVSNNMRAILSRLFVLPYGSNGMGSKSKHVLAFLFFISLTFPILHARLYAWINVVYEESCETFASNNLPSKGMTITKAYLVLSTQQTCNHYLYFLLSHVFKTWHELQNSIPSLFQGATRKSLPNTLLWQPPRSMYS